MFNFFYLYYWVIRPSLFQNEFSILHLLVHQSFMGYLKVIKCLYINAWMHLIIIIIIIIIYIYIFLFEMSCLSRFGGLMVLQSYFLELHSRYAELPISCQRNISPKNLSYYMMPQDMIYIQGKARSAWNLHRLTLPRV
jgi:hypothetical protein